MRRKPHCIKGCKLAKASEIFKFLSQKVEYCHLTKMIPMAHGAWWISLGLELPLCQVRSPNLSRSAVSVETPTSTSESTDQADAVLSKAKHGNKKLH